MLGRLLKWGLCGLLFFSAGCAPSAVEKKRFFWPPATNNPKIEYIEYYQSNWDVSRGDYSFLDDVVLGKLPPEPLFVAPKDIVSDGLGKFYVSDPGAQKVVVVNLREKAVEELRSPNGLVENIGTPLGLALSKDGRLFVADALSAQIYVFDGGHKLIDKFGKGGLKRPTGVCVNDSLGQVYVVDTPAHRLAVYDFSGKLLYYFGERGPGQGRFNFPVDCDVGYDDSLYVMDSMNSLIQVFKPAPGNLEFLGAFGERGTTSSSFKVMKGVATHPEYDQVYVTDGLGHKFVIFDSSGEFLLNIGGHQVYSKGTVYPGGFNMPSGIDVDSKGGVWLVDSLNRTIHKFQYLDSDYLQVNPIKTEDVYVKPGFE